MTHARNIAALWLAVVLLAGCQWLGLATPETFAEKAAAAYASVTTIREQALGLLTAGAISADDAENIQAQADVARDGIEVARQLHAASPEAGEARIDAVITGLTVLRDYLATRKGVQP